MKIYDNSEFGILVRMQKFLMLLKITDNSIYDLFEKQKLKPEYYAFRWLTLLLSQEFQLPDVLRIWDSLFADQERNFEFLLYICCAMVMYVNRLNLQTLVESKMSKKTNVTNVESKNVESKNVEAKMSEVKVSTECST